MSEDKTIVIATNLDGTLLDAMTFGCEVTKPCVARCLEAEVPVICISSKTVSEQLPIRKALGLDRQLFVVENGSAIVAPQGYFTTTHIGQALCTCGFRVQISRSQRGDDDMVYEAIVLGITADEIRKVLDNLKTTCPCLKDMKTFSDLSIPELAELTGLSQEAAERAQAREYSQTICTPLNDEQKEVLHDELRKHSMTFACGGRFHCVTAFGMDKGAAVALLRSLLEVKLGEIAMIGLGDAENDRTMLQAVDRAFLVKRPDGTHCDAADPANKCVRVQGVGPEGWVEAVSGVLDKLEEEASLWDGSPCSPKYKRRPSTFIPECWPCESGIYDSHDFLKDLDRLRARKKELGATVSFIFPTLEEEETIGYILKIVNGVREGLLDEVIVIDGNSKDRTREIAAENGARVILAPEVLPDWQYRGKGIQLWKSLLGSMGDICCWCDSDITNFSEVFVVGLVGPLLADPECRYVKAFYKRPLRTGDSQGSGIGGRVTELLARPFINLYYPELHDIIQPLSGEFGGWRKDLERLSFMVQYGVETKLLLEFSRIFGADSIRQVNLHERHHRHQSLPALSKMSFLILQTFFTDMAERFQKPGMMHNMQSTTRIIRAQAATNDNVNKSRSTDRELADEQHAEGIIASSLQEVTAKEIPLPPIVTQSTYLESFYPGLTASCVVLVALHESKSESPKDIQDAAKSLGDGMRKAGVAVAKVVADVSSTSGLPLRAAADLIASLPDGTAQPQLDILQLRPSEEEGGAAPSEKRDQEVIVELLSGLAEGKIAGDFEQKERTSVIIAASDAIKVLYKMAYRVSHAKAFEDAEKDQQLSTAWRFDYLHAPGRPEGLVAVQMRQLPLW